MTIEKSVLGATKKKEMGPKQKYIDALVNASYSDHVTIRDMLTLLSRRMHDDTWSVCFKALITLHYLLRDGYNERLLTELAKHPRLIEISSHSKNIQDPIIKSYHKYLRERVVGFKATKYDNIRKKQTAKSGVSRLATLKVEKGLLRETSILQRQLDYILNCEFHDYISNEVTYSAFHLLMRDLADMFKVVTEALVNILQQFLTLSKTDAETAINIYKRYVSQDKAVEQYLERVKRFTQPGFNIEPRKSAPLSMLGKLQDWVNDPNFAQNRQEIVDAKEGKMSVIKTTTQETKTSVSQKTPSQSISTNITSTPVSQTPSKAVDFFASIENDLIKSGVSPVTGSGIYNPFSLQSSAINSQFTGLQSQVTGLPTEFGMMQNNSGLQSHMTGLPNHFNTMPASFGGIRPQMTGYNPFIQNQNQTLPQTLSSSSFISNSNPLLMPQTTGFISSNPFSNNTLSSSSPLSTVINMGGSLPSSSSYFGNNPFSSNISNRPLNPFSTTPTGNMSAGISSFSTSTLSTTSSLSLPNPSQQTIPSNPFSSTNFESVQKPNPFSLPIQNQTTGLNPFSTQSNNPTNNNNLLIQGTNPGINNNLISNFLPTSQPNGNQIFTQQSM